jgi:hypothetical protein
LRFVQELGQVRAATHEEMALQLEAPKEQDAPDDLPWDAISWWLALIVGVLAIPSLAFVIVTVMHIKGIMSITVFTVACWACTYFGMHLVKHHPSMREKIDFTKRP